MKFSIRDNEKGDVSSSSNAPYRPKEISKTLISPSNSDLPLILATIAASTTQPQKVVGGSFIDDAECPS